MAYYPQYFQPMQQIQPQQPTSSGLVPVPSEAFARSYPVRFGESVSFRDENLPFLYTKTMGFSQLEPPKFEKYRLVKEESESPQTDAETQKPTNTSYDDLKAEIEAIRSDVEGLKNKVYAPTISVSKKKKEVIVDDAESE